MSVAITRILNGMRSNDERKVMAGKVIAAGGVKGRKIVIDNKRGSDEEKSYDESGSDP